MQSLSNGKHRRLRRAGRQLALSAAFGLGLCGCANFWDDVTSRDFTVSAMFTSKDPMVVLRESNDGNERHKALAALREPSQSGGSQKDQDAVLKILELSATSDQQALCRLAALHSLGHFKDPRAAEILDAVYLQNLPFDPDMTKLIREECLISLAETGGPVALHRLVLVAKEPPASEKTPLAVKQETLDRRITAVRCLGKFKDPEAAAALAYVLRTDKEDIAIRDRAHESLQACTGKRLPADSPQWLGYLRADTPPNVVPAGGTLPQGQRPAQPVTQSSGRQPN